MKNYFPMCLFGILQIVYFSFSPYPLQVAVGVFFLVSVLWVWLVTKLQSKSGMRQLLLLPVRIFLSIGLASLTYLALLKTGRVNDSPNTVFGLEMAYQRGIFILVLTFVIDQVRMFFFRKRPG